MRSANNIFAINSERKKTLVKYRSRFQLFLSYKRICEVDERGSILGRGIHFPLCHYIQSSPEADTCCHLLDTGAWYSIKNIRPQYRARNPVSFGEKKKVPSLHTKVRVYFRRKCWPSEMELLLLVVFISFSPFLSGYAGKLERYFSITTFQSALVLGWILAHINARKVLYSY
jgi:hypothetical protein